MRKLAVLALLTLAVSFVPAQGYIGRLDTLGTTTYDWQNGWHAMQFLVNAPEHGLHAVWMRSAATGGTTFPDRNMCYSYYDFATRQWGGADVFPHRAGYGNVDYDPATGVAIIGSHYTGTGGVTVKLAKDAAPGAGIFDYADGEPVLGVIQWPRIAVGQNGTIHVFAITAGYVLGYSRILPGNWPTYEPLRTPIDPSPGFPTFPLAASKVSGRVCLVWEISTNLPEDAYMQTSTDDGETWTNPELFPPPPAYGGDTVTSFHITSLYPWYDWEDRLHVVANVMPMVNDTGYIIPSQIWHYCAENSPPWSRIHIATCEPANLLASVGYNATYACRPCIGGGNDGRLYVAWEQFDSSNVEPLTNRLRAGIWVSSSPDNGSSWTPGLLVTERNTFSHRFPSIVDRMIPGGPSEDTICILYMIDSVSGFFVQSEGPVSFNPIVCQFIASPLVGVREAMNDERRAMNVGATIVRGVLFVPVSSFTLHSSLFSLSGQKVMALHPGANDVRALAPGVYFVRAVSRELSAVSCHKVVIQR
jgi:hypothetical protein